MDQQHIVVRGAREHNLRDVNLNLPKNGLIVFTGVSGSGKSSLAFDTLYAEGQRRYVESLSSYARQFLGQLPKPDVDYLAGLAPAISIQQKTASRNPRSTVGTVTEVYDFLRVLYARVGTGHCPKCGRVIAAQSREQVVERILALPAGARFLILAPVVRGQKGEHRDLCEEMLKRGYVRARIDGRIVKLADDQRLDRRVKHDIAVVVDRLTVEPKSRTRLAEAVEQALALANGTITVAVERPKEAGEAGESDHEDMTLSANYACSSCQLSYEEPSPQLFSFNSPQGMCLDCDGLGTSYTFDADLLIPDPGKSFAGGAVVLVGPFKGMGKWRKHIFEGVAKTFNIDLKAPWKDLPDDQKTVLLYGAGPQHISYEWKQRGGSVWRHGGTWEGVIPQLLAGFKKAASGPRRMQLEKYMRVVRCPACNGQRLNAQARAVRVGGLTLTEACGRPVGDLASFLAEGGPLDASLEPVQRTIASELLKEIRARLGFLVNVGLHYLTLDRSAPTLSGGEAQRIRLAGQIGSGLVGVMYILDEPSIGLHPRDNERLLASLLRLRDVGNTVIVVEHDEDTMRAADYIVDFGPGPGVRGGEVVAAGSYAEVLKHPESLTGQYLSGRKKIEIPAQRRSASGKQLRVEGARHHNLKNVTVEIPLNQFVVVTGVSGSGKSSLVNDILLPEATRIIREGNRYKKVTEKSDVEGTTEIEPRADFDRVTGVEQIDKMIAIDQSPIGRTPRSNPATYIKLWDEIRTLFASIADSKVRGYQAGRFSFNRPGGRCEACEGNGATKLEMDFLADVWVTCPVCEGRRFNRETLQVRYRGKSIYDVLQMDVQEALQLFERAPKIAPMLQTLHDVGLDYIKIGQPSPTLSGGEAQRIKLAKELVRRSTGKTLYVLDEPTTGLHFEDIRKLLSVLQSFVNNGNSVLVIEHNLDVIKTADHLIDMGPDGGSGGGEVIVVGTPETVAACEASFTGKALKPVLSTVPPTKKKAGKKAAIPARQAKPITELTVEGAEQHNLKHVSVSIPRDRMTVCSGPSGSGKSSLAIDTIYAEGQRRYVESLSSYARQFLGQVQKPKVQRIEGLSPSISIEQKTTARSPRSTVGTITEIYDYLRVLFARLAIIHCPKCQIPVGTQSTDEIVEQIQNLPEGSKLYILAPLERKGQEKYEAIWDEVRRAGFSRIRVDKKSYALDEPPTIDHRRKHDVEVVIDRVVIRPAQRTRVADAVEQALTLGKGVMGIAYVDDGKEEPSWPTRRFSQHLACESCGRSFEPLNPHQFSFNSPLGWCPACEGLGVQRGAATDMVLRNEAMTLRQGVLAAWPDLSDTEAFLPFADSIARHLNADLDTPYRDLEPAVQRGLLYGTGDQFLPLSDGSRFQYKGIMPAIDEASRVSFSYRQRLEHLVSEVPCPTCRGSRLQDVPANAQFQGQTIGEMCHRPLDTTHRFFEQLKLPAAQAKVAGELLREIRNRVQFLIDVGLEYLTLARSGPTLSGGEAQRIRLASQIGSGLTGVLYVLDEPTIGLHPRDNRRLLSALHKLRDLGNTLLLVEHDREVIESADYVLDFGPGAGSEGGEVTARGTPLQLRKSKTSLTGAYLSGKRAIPVPSNRRLDVDPDGSVVVPENGGRPAEWLTVVGARHHNLKNVTARFPLSAFVAVTGVSGSGKSSLVHEVLHNTLARKLHRAQTAGAAHDRIEGIERIDKIINVDQSPIGHTPSSNPATYTGVFDLIRQLYAQLPDAKVRGYPASRFSFNKPGGRCEACEGNGQKKIEMHFLPDVWVECDVCHGLRYGPETLAVQYRGKSIADVLNMRIRDALELFGNIPKIRIVLQTLADVGLGYLALGQSAPTLSGGEAQRVKLAAELARPQTGKTLYLLDEPTTGLHFDDIRKLLEVLNRLVDLGNTVIVVEHNLDVIKTCDWVIDIGPEAGAGGGSIVAEGSPEMVAQVASSHTGRILAETLIAGPVAARGRFDAVAHTSTKAGDMALEAVGADAALPWETDGQRWHTRDRITTKGIACRWDGDALTWVEAQIRKIDGLGPTDWNSRTIVEIAAKVKSAGWFLHASTGGEWLLRLSFRVGRNSFKQATLAQKLAIPPCSETPGLQVYGRQERVEVNNLRGPWQEVNIHVFKRAEIETDAFEQFLRDAAKAFFANLSRMKTTPEDVMPWKVMGERWHTGEKGFPVGRRVQWDRTLLPRLLQVVKQVVPNAEYQYDVRDAMNVRFPGVSRFWLRIKTKDSDCLELRLVGPPGKFNLSRLDGLGYDAELLQDRNDGDVVLLHFRTHEQMPAAKLRDFLADHAAGFRAKFASAG